MNFALIGNPNCGKTTLFNQLTGSKQHVGNFPGVTVDKKEGRIRKREDAAVVDLPGIYSLSPYTAEEIVTRDFLIKEHPDGIINIVDASNIERNLYLTLQLLELGMPMIVALNMMDVVAANGGKIDIEGLEEKLGIPIIPISASKNQGIDDLIRRAVRMVQRKELPQRRDFCSGDVHRAIHSISHLVEDEARTHGVALRFAAVKLVEGDERMLRELEIQEAEQDIIRHIVDDMEFHCGMDREAALADARYQYIEALCSELVVKPHETRGQQRSVKIDRILTHRIFAIPIFLADLRSGGGDSERLVFRRHRLSDRTGGRWAPGAADQRGAAVATDRRCLFGRGKRSLLPADYRPAVFPAVHIGGQRIYGEGGFCHGQAPAENRTFRPVLRSDADRIRLLRSRDYGYPHAVQ